MENKQNKIKIYKVGGTYYRLDMLQSMSGLSINTDHATGQINGKIVEWYIGYSHYKPHFQTEVIENDETYKEYNALLKAFKEQ